MENRFSFDYQHYDSPEGMPAGDRELVEEARLFRVSGGGGCIA